MKESERNEVKQRIRQWLLSHGFTGHQKYMRKGDIRFMFGKLAVRMERKNKSHKQVGHMVYTQHYERIGGGYYKNITFGEHGMPRGMGLTRFVVGPWKLEVRTALGMEDGNE